MYEIIYALSFLSALSSVAFITLTDSFFMGVCLHIVAAYKDLQDMIAESDLDIRRFTDGTLLFDENTYSKLQ